MVDRAAGTAAPAARAGRGAGKADSGAALPPAPGEATGGIVAAGAVRALVAGVDAARCLSPCRPLWSFVRIKRLVWSLPGPLSNLGQKHTDLSPVTDVTALGYSPKSFEVISAMFPTARQALS
ncbi:hypothetical protein GCM10012289_37910 [Nonomuraea cavernae]|uniref:Uncharacterized protein n=1 Tax=Nonomuraea cavernae TaxID=2045107 RepID=A0A918DKW9_9ACTN|nr:hypothetical protein GCM10012289_37910 [Nonomuraea cavernae]